MIGDAVAADDDDDGGGGDGDDDDDDDDCVDQKALVKELPVAAEVK